MRNNKSNEGFEWQVGIWDKMSDFYALENEPRFAPVIKLLIEKAEIESGQYVTDLGTGTGGVAFECVSRVGPKGRVSAVDISPRMLAIASARAKELSLSNVEFLVGQGEKIPVADNSQDVVLASLSMMYVIDRAEAAHEIARVLRPSGKFVASVWAGPEQADIVKFQQIAGSFAPKPPVQGVGPGALADPAPFLKQLSDAGLKAKVETEITEFQFENFESAWKALADVTTSDLDAKIRENAKAAVCHSMWPDKDKPRAFRNETHYICAVKPR